MYKFLGIKCSTQHNEPNFQAADIAVLKIVRLIKNKNRNITPNVRIKKYGTHQMD